MFARPWGNTHSHKVLVRVQTFFFFESAYFLKAIWQYGFKKNQKLEGWICLIQQSLLLGNCPKEIIGQVHKSEIT